MNLTQSINTNDLAELISENPANEVAELMVKIDQKMQDYEFTKNIAIQMIKGMLSCYNTDDEAFTISSLLCELDLFENSDGVLEMDPNHYRFTAVL